MRARSAGSRPLSIRRAAPRRRELSCLIAAVLASGAAVEHAAAREVPFAEQPAVTTDPIYAEAVFAGDVDGDGDVDMLSASSFDDKIAWYENTNANGDGSSWTAHTITTSANGARSVYAADVDGDGDLDALSASIGDHKIAWYENTNGDGSAWSLHTITTSANYARSVFAADVDGDGDVDALSASGNKIAWYENTNGDGSAWSLHTISTNVDGADSVFAADVDGDGDVDALSASKGSHEIAWHKNTNGDGSSWTTHTIATSAISADSVFAADVDGDGDGDVLSASTGDDKIAWYENLDGDGSSWTTHTITTSAVGARSVFGADVDGDGDLDALSTSYSGSSHRVAWHENTNGDGSAWSLHTITTNADKPYSVFAADVDGDGDVDTLLASHGYSTGGWKIAWFRNDTIHRSAEYPGQTDISTDASSALSVFAADVDDDGDRDALSASLYDDKIAWYENTAADGTAWSVHTISTSAEGAIDVYAADVDGDGDVDALSASVNDSKIAWYENTNGDGSTWTLHTISTAAISPRSVFVADVNGDGDLDALSASVGDNKIAWYENTAGDGSSWATHTITTAADEARSVFAGDVDGDGDLDVLSASRADNKIAWYENTAGDGSSWATHTITTGADFAVSVFAADMDGDGDVDVLSASSDDDKIAWYENTAGDGSSWAAHTITTGADFALSVFATDVDGDGDVDALSASRYDDKIAWYENTAADGTTWRVHTISTDAVSARTVFAADVNGDGDLDALSASLGDDKIAWYENRGGQFALPTLGIVVESLADNSETLPLLDIQALHLGRSGDSDAELATLEVLLTDGGGTPLTSGQADNLVEDLEIWLDDGSGAFEAGSDTLVHTVSSFSLTASVETIPFSDGLPNAQLPFGTPNVYFVVADLTANADSQTPSSFQVTHLTESSSTGEDAAADIPLTLEFWPDTGTGLIMTRLDSANCQTPAELVLSNRTVTTTVACEAGTFIRAGDAFVVGSGGTLSLSAGETIRFTSGFHVDEGTLTVNIDPTLKP